MAGAEGSGESPDSIAVFAAADDSFSDTGACGIHAVKIHPASTSTATPIANWISFRIFLVLSEFTMLLPAARKTARTPPPTLRCQSA
jgi:hypothetical protein